MTAWLTSLRRIVLLRRPGSLPYRRVQSPWLMSATAASPLLLVPVEGPADRRAHAEHVQQFVRGPQSPDRFGWAVAGDVERVLPVRRDAGERVALIFPGRDVEEGGGVAIDAQLLGVVANRTTSRFASANGSGRTEHAVHDGEDRSRRANAEGERQDGDRRKATVTAHHAKGAASVLDQPLGEPPAPGLARRFADQRGIAEVPPGREPGLVFGEPGGGALVGLFGEMKPDLFVELGFLAVPAKERSKRAYSCRSIMAVLFRGAQDPWPSRSSAVPISTARRRAVSGRTW